MRINRFNCNEDLAEGADIFFKGKRQEHCFEAYVDGGERRKRGYGYAIRAVLDDSGNLIPTVNSKDHPSVKADHFNYRGLICEKVEGQVYIRV